MWQRLVEHLLHIRTLPRPHYVEAPHVILSGALRHFSIQSESHRPLRTEDSSPPVTIIQVRIRVSVGLRSAIVVHSSRDSRKCLNGSVLKMVKSACLARDGRRGGTNRSRHQLFS